MVKPVAAFLEDFRKSIRAVERFAALLRRKNVSVWLSPTEMTPDVESRMDYADSGDLMLQLRAEHKVRTIQFTSREDFPFPTIIIDEKYKVDAKAKQSALFAYFIESSDGQCVACVYGHTKHRWKTKDAYDKKQGRDCTYYVVPIECVRFCKPEEIFL
jgi:hypothetical protein